MNALSVNPSITQAKAIGVADATDGQNAITLTIPGHARILELFGGFDVWRCKKYTDVGRTTIYRPFGNRGVKMLDSRKRTKIVIDGVGHTGQICARINSPWLTNE